MTTTTHPRSATPGRSADEAFRDFVQTNTPALTRTAYGLTGSDSAAEEMVQDTLVRLYPQLARVQNADVPLAYARRALTNRILTAWRRGTGREVLTDTVPDRPASRSAESDIVDRDAMWTLLQTLSGRQRTALVLRYYEGLSDVEIAEVLGTRYGTVRSLISRGLATLRGGLDGPPHSGG
jgi:RNA polymerase sigma-70 factor (sigma-E family)